MATNGLMRQSEWNPTLTAEGDAPAAAAEAYASRAAAYVDRGRKPRRRRRGGRRRRGRPLACSARLLALGSRARLRRRLGLARRNDRLAGTSVRRPQHHPIILPELRFDPGLLARGDVME